MTDRRGNFDLGNRWNYLHFIKISCPRLNLLLPAVDARDYICYFGLADVGAAFLIGACRVDGARLDTRNDCALELGSY